MLSYTTQSETFDTTMFPGTYPAYGSAPSANVRKPIFEEDLIRSIKEASKKTMLPVKEVSFEENVHILGKKEAAVKKRPTIVALVGCLVVPLLIFIVMIWLRSFELRYKSETVTNMMCCILLFSPLVFAALAIDLAKRSESDPKPMALLAGMSLLAWLFGFYLGCQNFERNMRPFYDIAEMSVYPSVEPSKYGGQQFLDAGLITFTPGSRLDVRHSAGFREKDVYCAAPIVSKNATQKTFDFWAIGMNCCSGHRPDFHCGEYSNPSASKGLRLLDDDKSSYFRLAVKKAQVEFNLNVSHPIFFHWLSHPEIELSTYEDDGWKVLVTSACCFFCLELFVIVSAAVVFSKM